MTDFEVQQLTARVEELESKVAFLLNHFSLTYQRPLDPRDQRVADALKTGNKLEAIKIYREIHNADLETAKKAVEAIGSMDIF